MFVKRIPRLAAAALFAAGASMAVLATDATHAGQPAAGLFASAPQAASAAVRVGIGVGVGAPYRFYRYAYRGGTWVRIGFGYAAAPGFVNGYYVGYAPPAGYYYPAPAYYRPYGYPYNVRPFYARPYYWHPHRRW
ncbi:MAG: hypothetical protein WAN59_09910 [Candidatus Baltobacteraceae bacterium]